MLFQRLADCVRELADVRHPSTRLTSSSAEVCTRVLTGLGGPHLYYRNPGGRVCNSVGKIARQVYARGNGSRIVNPGTSTAVLKSCDLPSTLTPPPVRSAVGGGAGPGQAH